ncbi:porin [Psychrobium sp. 1_MG-2023]|uniref:porin n=1 Tax=Psychrobium sp. 1_MG-2023 TaxID=3062624 RepID=UPI000C349CAD|nr:porin [Psychrobium sp. 1_MG-2023]MDP2561578.1 porin [Psychrobium sp. 1_MG-2023]PKF55038.1 porin [Alteromonadales bacterium alter-6D02]
MKTKITLCSAAIACSLLSLNTQAAVTLYENDGMSFSSDGLVNVFYSNSSIEKTDATGATSDRDQSRVRMGFLPNNIGFNFANQMSDVKVDVRSSFWVSVNDSDNNRDASPNDLGTGTLIDVRQFYGKVSGDWGEVLIGKDFGLFNRENIMNDQLLLGFGQTSDFFGLVDGGNVSFGNISTGYTYTFPKSQITYRSKEMNGFKFAVGLMDPNKAAAGSSEDMPRLEAELIYSGKVSDGADFKAWASAVTQSSQVAGKDHDQSGVGYGAKFSSNGFSLTASGYQSEGLGHVAGLDHLVGSDDNESSGFLVQGAFSSGANRFVLTYGESENENKSSSSEVTHSNAGVAYFRTLYTGVTFVAEFNKTEVEMAGSPMGEENNTIALGAVLTF